MSKKRWGALRKAGWAFAMLGVVFTVKNWKEAREKREREAKAKAAAPRSYGDRGNSARAGQPRGPSNDANRGGGNRVGVRGRFKD